MAMPLGTTKEQCRQICRDDKGMLPFYCKSFHYSDASKLCLFSEHGPGSQVTNSSDFSYHESICIQGGKNFTKTIVKNCTSQTEKKITIF